MSLKTWRLSKYTDISGPSCRVETDDLILRIASGSLCIFRGNFTLKKINLASLRKPPAAVKFQALSVFLSAPSGAFDNRFRFRLCSESDLREVCEVLSHFGNVVEGPGSQGDAFSQNHGGSPFSGQNSSQVAGSVANQRLQRPCSYQSQKLSGSPFHSLNSSQGSGSRRAGSNQSQKLGGSPFHSLNSSQGSGSCFSQKSSYHSGSNLSQSLDGSPFGSQVSSRYSDAGFSQELDDSPFSSQNLSQGSGSIFSQNSSQSSSSGMSQGLNDSYQELRPAHRNLTQAFSEFSQHSQPAEPKLSASPNVTDSRTLVHYTQPVEPTFSIPPVIRHCEKFMGYSQPLPTRNGGFSPSTPSPLVDTPIKPIQPTKVITEMSTQTDDEMEFFVNCEVKGLMAWIAEKPDLKRLVERFSEALEDDESRTLFDWIPPPGKRVAVALERSHVSLREEKTPQKSRPDGGNSSIDVSMHNEDSEFSPLQQDTVPRLISLRSKERS